MKCQIGYPELRDELPCKELESGGIQCEYRGAVNFNPNHDHRVSEHTIRHAIIGNGFDCCLVTT